MNIHMNIQVGTIPRCQLESRGIVSHHDGAACRQCTSESGCKSVRFGPTSGTLSLSSSQARMTQAWRKGFFTNINIFSEGPGPPVPALERGEEKKGNGARGKGEGTREEAGAMRRPDAVPPSSRILKNFERREGRGEAQGALWRRGHGVRSR